ncbi:uncharacterized protein I303_108394 [Kwoniella dejecticola CBS 10117]|uniref:ubiquitinyl hydrolase 1 n=1 Tax=Kwoniella dejecticola CBS 10117 TaxID=1296121 RepID=A0A1A5ZXI8_9TREE|nr:uncharacterized protein I303_07279 [Kwoniella dejecticola CBS 10117]OBR82519.1 hypothetical protein I303_07279 [Kwoniella dejecticola CBS 10117]
MARLLRGFGTPKQSSDSKVGGSSNAANVTPNGSRPSPTTRRDSTFGEALDTPDPSQSLNSNTNALVSNNKAIPKTPKELVVEKELLFGLENFGNTCYCNSVIQALYSCEAFKQFVESYPDSKPPLMALAPTPSQKDYNKSMSPILSPFATGFNGGAQLSPQMSKSNPFESPSLNTIASSPNNSTSEKKGRSWTSLGRRPTNSGHGPSSANLPTLGGLKEEPSETPVLDEKYADWKPIEPDPNQSPPSVFQTIQTLFYHLTHAPPHQPLPKKENKDANAQAQTASLLPGAPPPPAEPAADGSAKTPAAGTNPNVPQGPPLLASLPPPSAARGGGPWQAGKLGRGVVTPEDLLRTVKRENEMFRGMMQQDAHEFLGWLLNQIAEEIEILDKHLKENQGINRGPGKTFIQSLFEGVLTNETRCLSCETTSERDELFLDLSIDIEQHTSVTHCLRQFSASEMLCQKNKFYCDSCCGLQEAEKRMKIKKLPNILALHLKRFKYQETTGRYAKLFYRVPFPTQLRLPNTTDDMENPDRLYELFSVVVHIGNGPHHGHYVTLVRSKGRWIMCDDENVEPIDDDDLFRYFGDYPSGAGYVLFYQAVDMDLASLGLKVPGTEVKSAKSIDTQPVQSKPVQPRAELKELKEHQLVDFSEEPTPIVSPQSSTLPSVPAPVPALAPVAAAPTAESPKQAKKPPPPPPSRKSSTSISAGTVTPIGSGPDSRRNSIPTPRRESVSSLSSQQHVVNGNGFIQPQRDPQPQAQAQPIPDRQLGFDASSSPANTRRISGATPPPPPPSRGLSKSTSNANGSVLTNQVQTQTQTQTQAQPQPQPQPQTPTKTPTASSRPSTGGSTTFSGLGVNVPNASAGSNAESVHGIPNGSAMSSSVISTSTSSSLAGAGTGPTGTSSSVLAKPIPPSQTQSLFPHQGNANIQPSSMSSSVSSSNFGALGRKTSTTGTGTGRDRTVSTSSQASSGNGYSGGGSLGRKLSGMSGKLGRSGSMAFGKLGIGKNKDKGDRIGE